jgi:16S rRNA (cytosine1402-N4)-methyltransferase
MKMGSEYHVPVLLQDCLNGLDIRPDGVYVDVTFGGGGHSDAILGKLGSKGRLVAFDRDSDAQRSIPQDERLLFIHQDFRWIKNNLKYHGLLPVDGILADLGVSSHQFDAGERGFSFRSDAPLDMRMDNRGITTATHLLAKADQQYLADILKRYGEVSNAWNIAKHLVQARADAPIDTTGKLKEVLAPFAAKKGKDKLLPQVFQALRIVVNDELASLEVLLNNSPDLIKKGGRLVVISYHSLEDRLVKHFLRSGSLSDKLEKDVFGNIQRPFEPLGKVISPSAEEIERNPRARSAKLRIATRK